LVGFCTCSDLKEYVAHTKLKELSCHRYVVAARLKEEKLRNYLREWHGIWAGSLYPDSAGAANTASAAFERK
jgi:hypothetical protein